MKKGLTIVAVLLMGLIGPSAMAQESWSLAKCIEYAKAAIDGNMDQIEKRFPTGYTVITRDNVDSEEAQQAIYKAE